MRGLRFIGGAGAISGVTPGARALLARCRDRRFPAPLPWPARSYCMNAAFMQLQGCVGY
jgi:hypothetical protein